ncbi:MAG TPA: HEAT repeat domain-containing protein [Kofleriaceae bacterium]|nr:HEAT repeat domain-containing protein [Kofleriaceae bacterium]
MGDVPPDETSAKQLRIRLEHGEATPELALQLVAAAALDAPTRAARLDACRLLGDLAGRALGAGWDVAERAAFALLEAARVADTAADRRGVLAAMGRGFRNLWLLPFVHRRLRDRDPSVAIAALHAAGGLGFPALEEAVAGFLGEAAPPPVRRAAIAALGRMGAMSAVDRLVPLVLGDPAEAAAALAALTEIRSTAGRDGALAVLDHDLEPEVQVAAVRYLAELGALEVLPVLRRLARHDDPEVRIAASLASRALKAERNRDAAERFLVALGEPDRAVRAVLARRLRTLDAAEVIEQAEILLGEDAEGVVQILGELRAPEITRYLLALGGRAALPAAVRARAVGSIEANQAWERAALAELAHGASATGDGADDPGDALRAAAVRAMGAFATTTELIDRIADLAASPSAAIRGAVLWACQTAARAEGDGAALARLVAPMLDDADPVVRRRAAYVAGNLGLAELAPALARRCAASEPPELRLAAYVALGELGVPAGVVGEVAAAIRREDDPRVLGAASNALVAAAPEPALLGSLAPRVAELLAAPEPRLREAGAELAGLLGGAVPAAAIAPLAGDPAPAVRGAAVWALGRLAEPAAEAALLAAFRDDDPAVHERAAAGLLRLGTPAALAQAIAFVASDGDPTARGALAAAIAIPRAHAAELAKAVDLALGRVHADDPAFEPLLRMKLETVAAAAAAPGAAAPAAPDIDAEITAVFPSFPLLVKLSGFEALVRSLRTAESLFHAATGAQGASGAQDADHSPPITLWMKVLENYVHAWLGPRLAGLQREPAALFDYVDRALGSGWPGYQRWLEPRWRDPAEVGGARVELPLRAIPNAVRELQEHRRKRLDAPLSVTEWARMLVLFAVDHPSGFRNLFKLGHKGGERRGADAAGPGQKPERTIALAHRLHTLAAVRNLVTHRANAGGATLAAFRRSYYAAFEDLIALA